MSSESTARMSFRSNMQQMFAALEISAGEDASATAESGGSQASAKENPGASSLLNGNQVRAETPSQPTLQSPTAQSIQASATSTHSAPISDQEAVSEAEEETDSSAASGGIHSSHTKSSVDDRPAAAKLKPLQQGSLSLLDATAVATQLFQPVQQATIAKAPPPNASQLATINTSDTDAGEHTGVTSRSPGSHLSVSNAGAAPNRESSPETPASDADGAIASRSATANHSPETATQQPTADGAVSNQSSEKDPSGPDPADPSTPSAADIGTTASLSSNSAAEPIRPQIAAARATTSSESIRGNRSGDSMLNPAAVEGIHIQPSAAAAGAAVVCDTATALPSTPGAGPSLDAHAGVSTADTFSTLDGASNSMHATWVHAGAHQAEAGFEDPVLGWVSVRAGVNAGAISAVVVPGSADATQALGAHMAGLHDYLQEQHSPVDSLTLADSTGTGANQGMQHQGQPQSEHNNQTASAQALSSIPPASSSPAQTTNVSGSNSPPILSGSGGRHISVMA